MTTKTVSLTLQEALSLETELGGYRDEAGNSLLKGLLYQKLSLSIKYHLSELLTQVTADRKFLNDQSTLLRDALGTPEEIEVIGKDPSHPKNLDYQKQMQEFLVDTKRELKVTGLSIEDFNSIETDEYYPVFFKVIAG